MLFGYPIEATEKENNWLHNCIVQIICSIHENLKNYKQPPSWPAIIPDCYRDKLSNRTGIRDKLIAYQNVLEKLSIEEQEKILTTLKEQNKIADLLSCQSNCSKITDLPQLIQKPVKDLFSFLYSLLTDLEIRDEHYQKIYNSLYLKVCPFCGCEFFDGQGAPREALDHYLLKSQYSFAAANLRNLVPMGHKCNSKYKFTKDILKKEDGTRRKAFDPYNYNCQKIKFSLDNSQLFAGIIDEGEKQLPKWQIDLEPNLDEVITWDEVFHLRERYKRDVLDPSFIEWIRSFGNWCKSANISLESPQEVIKAIEKYAIYQESEGFKNQAFLQAAVFRMLHKFCLQGDERLIKLLIDVNKYLFS